MNRQSGYVEAILAIVLVLVFVGVLWFVGSKIAETCANNACAGSSDVTAAPVAKPITKTRCDYTGFMAPQMIEEEAQQGYFYTGRVATFMCEDAMVFQLREVTP